MCGQKSRDPVHDLSLVVLAEAEAEAEGHFAL